MSIDFPRPLGTAHDLIVQKRHNYATYRCMAVVSPRWRGVYLPTLLNALMSHLHLKVLRQRIRFFAKFDVKGNGIMWNMLRIIYHTYMQCITANSKELAIIGVYWISIVGLRCFWHKAAQAPFQFFKWFSSICCLKLCVYDGNATSKNIQRRLIPADLKAIWPLADLPECS